MDGICEMIWDKPNCQPESVKDRFTVSHEYLFLFSKSEQYYFNQDAIKEQTADGNGLKNRRTVWRRIPNLVLKRILQFFQRSLSGLACLQERISTIWCWILFMVQERWALSPGNLKEDAWELSLKKIILKFQNAEVQ